MTTPNGAIVFNASTGDDNAASGLGPAIAQTGSGASTDGTAVVTGITTTGVSAGDLLWVQTASGRQFSIIASVDSGTQVTCDDTFVLGSGQTWAIGGKRATFDNSDSRVLFSSDCEYQVIVTETDQTLTSRLNIDKQVKIHGSGGVRTINQTTDDYCFSNTADVDWALSNLKFTNSFSGTKSICYGIAGVGDLALSNCIFGDPVNNLVRGVGRTSGRNNYFFLNCVFQHCTQYGSTQADVVSSAAYIGCVFHHNDGAGLIARHTYVTVSNCVFANNGGIGFDNGLTYYFYSTLITNCIFYGNGSHGLLAAGALRCVIANNVFYGNTGDAVNLVTASGGIATQDRTLESYGNYSESSATYTNFDIGSDVTLLTADIFSDSSNDDYSLNSTSGGGAELVADSFTFASTETRPFRWLDTSTGGGGATLASDARIERLK